MNIAIPKGGGKFHLLTNVGIEVGDRVFPLTMGYNDGQVYYVMSIETSKACSGWPDEPHIVLDLDYGRTKSYQVQTDKGYGPRESYFKLIAPSGEKGDK